MKKCVKLPFSFYHPLFFTKAELEVDGKQSFEDTLRNSVFLYDVLYQSGESTIKPWESQELFIPKVFEYWETEKTEIGDLFRQRRRKDTLQPMTRAIGHFISALFWTNGIPVRGLDSLKEQVKDLKHKPINLEERLDFLLGEPARHHSFVQLGELYRELTKQYYKMLVLKRK